MRIELNFAELHNPLFLNGTNLQMKLDPSKRQELFLIYDRVEKELLVYYKSALAIVPTTNVSSMTPKDPEIAGPIPEIFATIHRMEGTIQVSQEEETKATMARIGHMKRTAQVSSPTGHVFDQGPGKVRD